MSAEFLNKYVIEFSGIYFTFRLNLKSSNLMKTIFISVFVLFMTTAFAQKKVSLFNGKNLDGWSIYVSDSKIKPESFFYVNEGVIETVGVPTGYLRTVKEYSDYQLHVEWRYPEKPTNSGVFVHTNGPDAIWPKHYQCQLKVLNAGDFIVNAAGEKATAGDSIYIGTEKVKPIAIKLHDTNEKPADEWNSYDITCKGNRVEVKVNGLLQNVITDCSMTSGSIGLQAEGSKIQFRNIWIEKIK